MNIEEKNMSAFIKQIEESINKKSTKNKNFKAIEAFSIFQNECVYLVDFSQNKIIYKKGLAKLTDISFMDTAKNVNWTFKADSLNETAFNQQVYKAYKNFFTKREIEIIIKINKGLTNKSIGKKLYISEYTVAAHRKNILKKSNCHSQNELILFCKGRGII